MAGKIKKAEAEVLQQFRGSETTSLVNPLLSQFDRALDTTVLEYDPILDFDSNALELGNKDRDRLFALTCQAIANTYQDAIEDPKQWQSASLGPEDIRFLQLLRTIAQSRSNP